MHLIRLQLFLLLCAMVHSLSAQQNTILIIADDVSPDYFGCFSTTTDTATTPVISSLAERGIRFTKVWAAPVCSPTRAGIFTGRYPFRTGVGQVIMNATSPQLDTAEMSIAELLHDYAPVQYNTACVGKWHLHANTPPQRLFPNLMGFDFYSGNFNGAINSYYSYPMVTNGTLDSATSYATTQTVNDAIAWMDSMNTTKPFFLWLAFNAPHSPYHIPPANLCDTAGLTGTTQDINANPEKYFKAAIQAMDTEMGRLFQYLTVSNLMDSTNIIFVGDNGNATAVAQITNPAKAKASLYDYGVRVPMIVAGPVVNGTNRISDELINTPDLFATIAEICGLYNWSNFIPPGNDIDSRSFLHILQNQPGISRSWIFTEQFNAPPLPADGKTIRNQDYHLIRSSGGVEEFYNQTLDPEENNNLLNGVMTPVDISNYVFLCDSLTVLTGTGTCQPLATGEVANSFHIEVFPNPATGSLNVKSNFEIDHITILSMIGEEIAASNSDFMDVSSLPGNIYVLKIFLRNGYQTVSRVVIAK